jgi:hypothetical protein
MGIVRHNGLHTACTPSPVPTGCKNTALPTYAAQGCTLLRMVRSFEPVPRFGWSDGIRQRVPIDRAVAAPL